MWYCMTAGIAEVSAGATRIELRTTSARCPVCVMTLSLDDEQPKVGTVRWRVVSARSGLEIGTAESFECPNGHTSADDPALLKAFPSRRF
jgi:hypothetical protein